MTEVCENRLDRRLSGAGSEIVSGEPVQPSFLGVFVTKATSLSITTFNHRSTQGQPLVQLRVSFPACERAPESPVTSFTSGSRAGPTCHAAGQRSAPAATASSWARSSGANPLDPTLAKSPGLTPTTNSFWTGSFRDVNAHTVHAPTGSAHQDANNCILTPFSDR